MKTVYVTAVALIDADKRILLAKRPADKSMAGLWEFPGGKIDAGESPEEALIRELHEELGLDICHSCLTAGPFVSYTYAEELRAQEPGCDCPVDNAHFIPASQLGLKEPFHLVMLLYLCHTWQGTPHPHEGQILSWYRLSEMASLPMPPADRPLVTALHAFL